MPHDAYAAIRSSNYRWYAAGFSLSSTGLQMLAVTIGWEIYNRTNDPFMLGMAGLARAVPVVLLALIAGHAADVFSRRTILILTQGFYAVTAAAMAWWSYSQGPLWVLYMLLTVSGCIRAFNGPARSSLLPLLVPKEDFHNAVAWNTGVFHSAGVIGPVMGGYLIDQTGGAWASYAVTAILTGSLMLSGLFLQPALTASTAGKLTIASMFSGLGHIRREPTVFGTILIDCLGVLLGGATSLLPVFAEEILHVGPIGLGVLRAAPFAGAVWMAVLLAHRPPFERTGRIFLSAVSLWAVAIILFGLSTSFYFSVAMLLLQGALDNISVVIRHILVQVRTPDELRGRVSAVNSMFIEISNEMGSFESGLVASIFNPVISVVSGGLGTLGVVALIAIRIPALRRLGRIEPADETGDIPAK